MVFVSGNTTWKCSRITLHRIDVLTKILVSLFFFLVSSHQCPYYPSALPVVMVLLVSLVPK